ncbi:MerR family transcriptional regulator [Flexivirga sp.]|uniref:MerR family transcriptional regulator n=1 Tax=Flexivirga sp. TaxID=1962927 RepID=UPI003F803612
MQELTAGDFSRATGLSPKALRLYADSGLLLPQRIDERNGYRYYGAEQLARAQRITLLRRAGAPLSIVEAVVDAPDRIRAAQVLDQWWRGHEQLHREQRNVVDHLRAEFESGATAAVELDVRRRTASERTVASVTRRVLQPGLVATFVEAEQLICEHLKAHDASRTVEFWVIYHGVVSPDSDGPIEICVPFEGSVPPTADVMIRVEPGGDQLYTEIGAALCGYPQILQAYAAVARAAHGLQPIGAPRERYVSDWDGSPGAQHVADIVQPIATNH